MGDARHHTSVQNTAQIITPGKRGVLKMEFLSSRETAGNVAPYFGRDSYDGIHSFTIKCWQETGQKLAYGKTNLSSHLHILGFLLQI